MNEMTGKVCIVTGSNSGIGKETALGLAQMGAHAVMVVRNMGRGGKARAEIINKSGNRSIDLMNCDLSLMNSIRKFAEEFRGKYDRLDVLINNAGAAFNSREVTIEGLERTLAVDYFGPFLLTHELLPLLKSSAPSRIINLSSGLQKNGQVDLDGLKGEKEFDHSGPSVYANAKLMVTMFTYELARQLEGTGVTANVVLPGFVATNLGINSGSLVSSIMFKLFRPMQVSPKKGAETSLYMASSEDVSNVTGKCFSKKQEKTTPQISQDRQLQKQLWEKTLEVLGLTSY
ncbi:MAG: SDR family oxidoreductase [Nitrososphaeria archaeon]|jgi:NAD(P)-dependent dehydrogenase (short-subunit alcohol dehydrogenase family)